MAKVGRVASNAIGWFDYALIGVGSSLAVFSAGMAIVKPLVAWLLVGLVMVGTFVSYLIRVLARRTKLVGADAYLYPLAIIVGVTMWQSLQIFLPDDGFPVELFTAAWMCWSLVLGSFFTWRDNTLLFQAVPSVALFGLVGCYDTFRSVTFCFFGFMACLVTLFSRAHGRAMIRQGIESGYFNRMQIDGRRVEVREDNAVLYERIKAGPWRWMAGPEWALASALVIILLSVLGAPVVQYSVRNVAGLVPLRVPQSIRTAVAQSNTATSISSDTMGTVTVGRGPNSATNLKVLEADLDHARYLRSETFTTYTGRGWHTESEIPPLPGDDASDAHERLTAYVAKSIKHISKFSYVIRPAVRMKSIPVPGELHAMTKGNRMSTADGSTRDERTVRSDGTVKNVNERNAAPFSGESIETDSSVTPESCPSPIPDVLKSMTVTEKIPASVKEFAEKAVRGAKSDYEKADQISMAIGRQTTYNLDAEAVPGGSDPVEYFLFTSHEGYCDLFASSMTACARAVGLPARYVMGYYATEDRQAGNHTYVLSESDAHAWCEIFFKDYGWVIFDATNYAGSVDGAGRGSTKRGFWQQRWVQNLFNGLIFALVIAAGYVVARLAMRKPGESAAKQTLGREYQAFLRAIHNQYGKRRRIGMTTVELVHSAEKQMGKRRTLVAMQLANDFDRAFFGSAVLSEEAARDLAKRVRAFKEMLKVKKHQVHDDD